MFTSVRAPRVYEHIVEQVQKAIFEGRLRSGDRLPPEREMVLQFQASRVAVREALRTLEHRGLVEVRHGSSGGHFVRHADADLLRRDIATLLRLWRVSFPQLLEARLVIEPEIAGLAAQRATEAEVTALRSALTARTSWTGPARLMDFDFHRLLATAAHNPIHTVLVQALMDVEAEVGAPQAADNAEVVAAHAGILGAVASGKADQARTMMAEHVKDLQRRFQNFESLRQADQH
jgi:GntR family transcriptional repressor for pyruvate dehydrogenase complex